MKKIYGLVLVCSVAIATLLWSFDSPDNSAPVPASPDTIVNNGAIFAFTETDTFPGINTVEVQFVRLQGDYGSDWRTVTVFVIAADTGVHISNADIDTLSAYPYPASEEPVRISVKNGFLNLHISGNEGDSVALYY